VEANTTVVTRPGLIRRLVAFALDYVFITLASYIVTIPIVMAVKNTSANQTIANVVTVVVFILWQAVVPWFSHGQTLAGRFVHMTCETKQRTTGWRAAFYVVRVALLGCVVLWAQGTWYLVLILVLAVFWIVKRCMPYDLFPGVEWAE
jgi:hypothetical protein